MGKLNDFAVYEENPFQRFLGGSFKFSWKKNDDNGRQLVDPDSGEVLFLLEREQMKLLMKDSAEFSKVYFSCLDKLKNLTVPGLQVLSYVLFVLKKDSDVVYIDIEGVMEYVGYKSRTDVYRGIISLIENDFICRKTGKAGEYFINVSFIFNGKRTSLKHSDSLKEKMVNAVKKGTIKPEIIDKKTLQ